MRRYNFSPDMIRKESMRFDRTCPTEYVEYRNICCFQEKEKDNHNIKGQSGRAVDRSDQRLCQFAFAFPF